MLNETHHAPPRYKIPEFFSSLLGRQVRRGEHGVKVLTFIDCQRKDEETGQLKERFRRPFSTTVFHISQTDEIPGGAR